MNNKEVKTATNNGNGGFAWVMRGERKMNGKFIYDLGVLAKRFAKKYSSKKRRAFLKSVDI